MNKRPVSLATASTPDDKPKKAKTAVPAKAVVELEPAAVVASSSPITNQEPVSSSVLDMTPASCALWESICASKTDAEFQTALEGIKAETAPLIVYAFCRTTPIGPNEHMDTLVRVFTYMQEKRISLELLTTNFVRAAVNFANARRFISLVMLLSWFGYEACANRFTRQLAAQNGVTPSVELARLLLLDTPAMPNREFWRLLYIADESEPQWLKICRSKRVPLTIERVNMPPKVLVFDQDKIPEIERMHIRNFVGQLALECDTDRAPKADVAWAWIDFFWPIVNQDQHGAIVQLAIKQKNPQRIQLLVARGCFTKFATRLLLDSIWSKMEDANEDKGAGEVMMIAASLDTRLEASPEERAVPVATYKGLTSPLLRIALKSGNDKMFDDVVNMAPDLGSMPNCAETIRQLVKDLAVIKFAKVVRLPTIDTAHVWYVFSRAITGTSEKELSMFNAFLHANVSWCVENRQTIESTLEKRNLVTFSCDFDTFVHEHGNGDWKEAYLKNCKMIKKLAAGKEAGASTAVCMGCDAPNPRTLLCGHSVGCEDCILKLVTTRNGMRCPTCSQPVDTNAPVWYIKVYN